MMDAGMIKRIQDALGTAEEGAALVDVARAAHDAERRLAGPLYLAHWATDDDFHAEKDDGGPRNLVDMASPSGMILRDLEPVTVLRLLEYVTADIKSIDEETFPSDAKWEHVAYGDFINQWNLTSAPRGIVYAVLIVRKEETIL